MIEPASASRRRAGGTDEHGAGGRGPRRRRRVLAGMLAAAGAAAGLVLGAALPTAAAAATGAAGSLVPPAARQQVTATESDNGRTIVLRRGGSLTVVLHSTYWTIAGSSAPRVLSERGRPVTTPAPPSAHCVPGQGCGTVTARFLAVGDGRADVTASRTTCGEALMCAPNQRSYVLHVVVIG
jgi:hypothetical protein